VDGLNVSFVELTLTVVIVPEVLAVKVTYRVALLDVSSVIVTPEAGSAVLTQFVPSEISALFKAPGATVVTAPVAFPIITALAVNDVTPVPTGGAGTMVYDPVNNHFFGWNGSAWKQLDN
jgi:hypothetical protein